MSPVAGRLRGQETNAMAVRLTPISKLVLVAAIGVTGFFAVKRFAPDLLGKLAPAAKEKEGQVPKKADLPSVDPGMQTSQPVGNVTMPGSSAGCTDKPEVRMLIWAWNAQSGLMFANGGAQATQGSLMCEKGVNLRLIREDDASKMQEQLVTFATDLKSGNANPTRGAHFVSIMGDGTAVFLKGVNDTLSRLGSEYRAKVVGSCGYSRGEDKLMGPPAWKQTPSASRGGLAAGYLRDGDWNIAQKWLGDNGLCNNPDEKTWDPNCLNWVAADSYVDAAEKYVAGYCEDRPVVSKGKKTGETKRVCVDSVVTWTPGDVTVAEKKGGLVSVVSTKEYSSQMPNTIIGIDRWMKQNRSTVEGMLDAIFTGGNIVKSKPEALSKAAAISARVYNEQDAAYWEKYFRVNVERDKQGLEVELGGSSVNNLADNLLLFGLVPGSSNLYAATYRVFGDIVVQQYPELVPSYDPVDRVLDTSYIEALAKTQAPRVEAEKPKFEPSQPVTQVVSRRAWQINFDSGKSTFTPAAEAQLQQLLRDLLVAGATLVEIHGHTDNAGNPQSNMQLSEDRAFAVKQWLEGQSSVNFPEGRIRVFSHGQENPVASNGTPEGKARNRRVEIVLGTGR
jgi:OmpA-OmpF porin, OOP family